MADQDEFQSYYNKISIKKQPKRMPFWRKRPPLVLTIEELKRLVTKWIQEEFDKRFE